MNWCMPELMVVSFKARVPVNVISLKVICVIKPGQPSRWSSMEDLSGRNLPARMRRASSSKVWWMWFFLSFFSVVDLCCTLLSTSLWPFAGYSGGLAATVGSVLVTNLKTGIRRGGWDKAEVPFFSLHIFNPIVKCMWEELDAYNIKVQILEKIMEVTTSRKKLIITYIWQDEEQLNIFSHCIHSLDAWALNCVITLRALPYFNALQVDFFVLLAVLPLPNSGPLCLAFF